MPLSGGPRVHRAPLHRQCDVAQERRPGEGGRDRAGPEPRVDEGRCASASHRRRGRPRPASRRPPGATAAGRCRRPAITESGSAGSQRGTGPLDGSGEFRGERARAEDPVEVRGVVERGLLEAATAVPAEVQPADRITTPVTEIAACAPDCCYRNDSGHRRDRAAWEKVSSVKILGVAGIYTLNLNPHPLDEIEFLRLRQVPGASRCSGNPIVMHRAVRGRDTGLQPLTPASRGIRNASEVGVTEGLLCVLRPCYRGTRAASLAWPRHPLKARGDLRAKPTRRSRPDAG